MKKKVLLALGIAFYLLTNTATPAVLQLEARIRKSNGNVVKAQGSAVNIGVFNNEHVILTAAHTFERSTSEEHLVEINVRSQRTDTKEYSKWYPVNLRAATLRDGLDMAILTTKEDLPFGPTPLSASDPFPGQPVSVNGWGSDTDKDLRYITKIATAKDARNFTTRAIYGNVHVEHGMSGGPILITDQQGRVLVAGVITNAFPEHDGFLGMGVSQLIPYMKKELGGLPAIDMTIKVVATAPTTGTIRGPATIPEPEPPSMIPIQPRPLPKPPKVIADRRWSTVPRPNPRCNCAAKFAELERLIASIKLKHGRDGSEGKPGPAGKAAVIDYDKLMVIVDSMIVDLPVPAVIPGDSGVDGRNGTNGKDGEDGRDGRNGNDGVGLKGERGRDGRNGLKGKDGDSGLSPEEYKELKILLETLTGPAIIVIFEKGDDPHEPERKVVVNWGGELRIPPQQYHMRNFDVDGKPVGKPSYDLAPLGKPLFLKFQPPE